jgi:hypothetical protein
MVHFWRFADIETAAKVWGGTASGWPLACCEHFAEKHLRAIGKSGTGRVPAS